MVSIISGALRVVADAQRAAIADICRSHASAIAGSVGELEALFHRVGEIKATLLGANGSMQVCGWVGGCVGGCGWAGGPRWVWCWLGEGHPPQGLGVAAVVEPRNLLLPLLHAPHSPTKPSLYTCVGVCAPPPRPSSRHTCRRLVLSSWAPCSAWGS
jgi:hypothetical protein